MLQKGAAVKATTVLLCCAVSHIKLRICVLWPSATLLIVHHLSACVLCAGPKHVANISSCLLYFALLQDLTQTASKQARLGREEADVVSTSLPIPAAGTSQVDAQIRASVAAVGLDATAAGAQPDSTTADQSDVQHPSGRDAVYPLGSSRTEVSISPEKQTQGLLTSFLGDYGSDSDDSNEQAT